MEKKPFLTHVNALRGVAILLVFLYHLIERYCPNGYYGVDVFFVISGYFLFAPMLEKMDAGSFSWSGYYKGKLLRIMPMLVALTFAVLLAAAAVMPAADLLTNSLVGLWVECGVSNMLYARHVFDYFSPSLRESLFLHTWYLSVLIQILIAAPVLCWVLARFSSRRLRISILILLTIISLMINFQRLLPAALAENIPSLIRDGGRLGTVYYMTAARLWEVLAGAFVMFLPPSNSRALRSLILLVGLGLIIAPSFLPGVGWGTPLAVVFGAMLIIRYGCATSLDCLFQNRALMWIGSISFSLYLVHWPVLALWRYIVVRDFCSWEFIAVTVLIMVLSYALYRCVEKRRFAISSTLVCWGVLVGLTFTITKTQGLRGMLHPQADDFPLYDNNEYQAWQQAERTPTIEDFPDVLQPHRDFDRTRFLSQGAATARGFLSVGDRSRTPNFILLGDSYAHSVFPGLDLVGRDRHWSGLYMPIYLEPFIGGVNTQPPALGDAGTAALIKWLSRHPELQYVVINQRWHIRFTNQNSRKKGEPFETSVACLREFCLQVKQSGKTLIFIMPQPEANIDSSLRIDSVISRRSILTSDPYNDIDLSIDADDYEERNAPICKALRQLEAEGLCVLLDPVPVLMPDGVFEPVTHDRHYVIYDGAGHLTVYGATKLIEGLADRIDSILAGETALKQEAELSEPDASSTTPSPQGAS